MTSGIGATVLGYPRLGPRRELKRAVEQYWAGRIGRDELLATARQLRADTWRELREAGLDSIPSNTFSYYDQVLDTAALVGALPARFKQGNDLDTYFAAARGTEDLPPLEMTKWFDTNYHYLVPEIDQNTQFWLASGKPIEEYREARALGVDTRPVLLGPVTFLLLAKGADPLARLDDLLAVYAELLGLLAAEGVAWVQFDEPAFTADRTEAELAALGRAYDRLAALPDRPKLLVTGYYGSLGPALPVLAATPVEAIGVDLVAGDDRGLAGIPELREKTLVAGVVDGRNVWRADLREALAKAAGLLGVAGEVVVSTSCTLLHVPYDLDAESGLDPEVRSRLAFARQKVREVVLLGQVLRDGAAGARVEAAEQPVAAPRRDEAVRAEIARVIRLQEDIGLDVLVRGEPERNDMVQYFAEHLDGFASTELGWVQSYGSRCARPPIIHGDVTRPRPITVGWRPTPSP